MKKPKLIKKNQIVILYQYFLLGENDKQFVNFSKLNKSIKNGTNGYQQNLDWLSDFEKKKHDIILLISSNLKNGWTINRIPVLEKAIIISAVYMMRGQDILEKKQLFLLINQTMNFSKKYLEKEKCGYINKLLDLIGKNEMGRKIFKARELKKNSELAFHI